MELLGSEVMIGACGVSVKYEEIIQHIIQPTTVKTTSLLYQYCMVLGSTVVPGTVEYLALQRGIKTWLLCHKEGDKTDAD